MNAYSEKLQDPRWQKRRSEIILKDGFKCADCGSLESLHVHHVCYFGDRPPWDYSDIWLVTLCQPCHRRRHVEWEWQTLYRERLILAIKKQANPSYEPDENEQRLEKMNRIVATLPFPWWRHMRNRFRYELMSEEYRGQF